jgi:hypothetical protein
VRFSGLTLDGKRRTLELDVFQKVLAMEIGAARVLFGRYCELLDGSFWDENSIRAVERECMDIARELQNGGFLISDEFNTEFLTKLDDDGETRSVIVQQHNFMLVAVENQECETQYATAVSRIYGPAQGQSAEKYDVGDFVRKAKALPQIRETHSDQWRREWGIFDGERHVLESALVRNWEKLSIFAGERMIELESQNFYINFVRTAVSMAPTPEDAFVFNFCTAHEIRFLNNSDTASEVLEDCGCMIENHRRIIEEWQKRNLR